MRVDLHTSLGRFTGLRGPDSREGAERSADASAFEPVHWLGWLIVAAGVLYGAFFVAHLHEIITATWQDSDVSIVAVVAHMIETGAPVGTAAIGNRPLYEEILGLTVTGWLPFHRQIWLLAPLIWDVAGLALLGWSVNQAFNRRTAVFATITAAALGQKGREYFVAWNFHDLPEFHAILLLAALLYAARFEAPMHQRRVVVGAGVLGVLSAFPFASDLEFVFSGMAPVAGACLLLLVVRRDRRALQLLGLTLGVCLIAVGLGEVLTAIMRHFGFTTAPDPIRAVSSLSMVRHNLGLLLQGLTSLGGGDVLGIAPDGHGALATVRGVLTIAGLVLALVCVVLAAIRLTRRGRNVPAPQLLFTAFWALALALGLAVFLLSNLPIDYLSGRYLLSVYLAIPALLAGVVAGALRPAAFLAAAAMTLFVVCGAIALPDSAGAEAGYSPGPSAAYLLSQYAAKEHVSVGYASYWAAVSLTWETKFSLQLGAVHPCLIGTTVEMCPDEIAVSGWYIPRAHTRSMLIIDPAVPWTGGQLPGTDEVQAQNLGPPVAQQDIDGMYVYIYDYDIASHLPSYAALYPMVKR